MSQEFVELKVTLSDSGAEQKLKNLDELVKQLNGQKVSLNVDTSGLAKVEGSLQKQVKLVNDNIKAQARLAEAKNRQASIDSKIVIEAEKTRQAIEKTAQAQAKANAESAKAAQQAEKTRQAVEKTDQAQAKVQEAQARVAVEEAKVAQQAEKTKQAIEKTAQAQARVETVEQRRQLLAEQMSAAQDKASRSAESYNAAVGQVDDTPLQKQINAITGVDREFKSAAESARALDKALTDIEKKAGMSTGKFVSPNAGTRDIEDYIKNVEGIEKATVAATRTVEAGGRTFQQFSVSAQNAKGDFDNFTYSVDKATGEVHKFEQGASTANKTTGMLRQTIGDAFKEFAKWYVIGTIISGVTNALSDAVAELKNVDSELVNIQKVMGATSQEMEALSDRAYEVGSALGVAASDYLASVTKWAQAGYGELSADLGELSVRTQKVGDVQEDTANQFLLSVDAAYQYKGNIEALTRVLDGANEISNRYATSVEKLAGGMGIVSSLAAQAGMEVQETMAAIGTITAVTQESGNSAARALRALILNIQGSTEIAVDEASGERWTEDEIEATAAALNDLNIATREYKNGIETLRNPMEVIGELSEKYKQGLIDEVQLQDVVSSLGGKVRSNQLQALISNYDMYEEMLQTYSESVGSADRELDIYLNSWEAKSERLKNSWTELVASFQTDTIAKGALDVANALLQIANTPVGRIAIVTAAIAALNAALSAFAASQTGIKVISALKGIGTAFTSLAGVFQSGGLIAGVKALGTSFAAALGPVGLAIAAIGATAVALDKLIVTTQEHIDAAEEAKSEYEEATSTLEGLNEQLNKNREAIESLNAAGPLSLTDQADIERLTTENSLLATQIELEKERQRLAANKAFEEYYAAFDRGPSGVMGSGAKIDGNGQTQIQNYIELIRMAEAELASMDAESWGRSRLEDKITRYREKLNELETTFLNTYKQASIAEEYGNKEAQTFLSTYGDLLDTIQIFHDNAGWAVQQLDELATSSREFANALEAVKADGSVTVQEVENLLDAFPELRDILEKSGFSAEGLAEHLTSAAKGGSELASGASDAENGLSELELAAEGLSTTLSGLESAVDALNSAQEELESNGALSAGTIDALVQQFPELTDLLYDYLAGLVSEQELQRALSEQYNDTADSYRRSILEKMSSNEEFYKNTILTNTDIVTALAELGITDLDNYKTIEELKDAVSERIQSEMTKNAEDGEKDRLDIYEDEAKKFATIQGFMLAEQERIQNSMRPPDIGQSADGSAPPTRDFGQGQSEDEYWDKVMEILSSSINIPDFADSSSTGCGSSKSWYEVQIENLNELVSSTRDTNELLEREEANSYSKRIENLQAMQKAAQNMADQFRAKGLSDTSDEVRQLKLLWHELADDIEAVYQSMYDDLMGSHADDQWEIDLLEKNWDRVDKSVSEIAADNAKVVASYRNMQREVYELGQYYRALGYDETDDFIQDLSDKWWEYEHAIEEVYGALSDAFSDYISESDRKIRDLERSTGTAGQQIEVFAQRIIRAQETISVLYAENPNGVNNERISSIRDQIYADQDSISSLQSGLMDELASALGREFEKWEDKIGEAGDKLDAANKAVEDLEDELQDILDPIEDTLDDLNDRLEAEQKALEALTDPLNKQLDGYYNVNDDGTLGQYVPGINDKLDEINSQIEAENEKWAAQQEKEDDALALQEKELAVQEAIKDLEQAQLDLQTAQERTTYTLKGGVWAWRQDDKAVENAQAAVDDAEQAKEDAEKELQDLREQQAHDYIIDRLEDQAEALEKQKEQIETQIDLYERESKARQEYINEQIDHWEQEKESWEDHYNALQKEYEDEIDFWSGRVDELQEKYDQWTEEWDSLQSGMEEPVRAINEILDDIATYGTPQMKAQVENITDLLAELGASLGGSGQNQDAIISIMKQNTQLWKEAQARGDTETQDILYQQNQLLGAMIPGAWLNPGNGKWYGPDGNVLYDDGGVAHGRGLMVKGTSAPEVVLSPVLAADVLDPVRSAEFDRFTRDMGIMYGVAQKYNTQEARMTPGGSTTNNHTDSHNTYINGVEIGDSMLDRPLSEILSLLGLYRNH